ncbi:Carbohydrate esterase 4 protein [Serendipita sp. 400]|nr:Carbohydrate esterase 4 protein [Serendipita sp. 400]
MKISSFLTFACVLVAVQAETINEVLKRSGVVITECKKPKSAALTWDDGPNDFQVDIGTILQRAGARGTFFVCGNGYHCIYDYAKSVQKGSLLPFLRCIRLVTHISMRD